LYQKTHTTDISGSGCHLTIIHIELGKYFVELLLQLALFLHTLLCIRYEPLSETKYQATWTLPGLSLGTVILNA